MAEKQKRIRRRPEESRALILDAAEKAMQAEGPAGLRLQEVARLAGVSHPTILHHFGNREGLMRALNGRVLEELRPALLAGMTGSTTAKDGVARTFAAYRGGLAQRFVWMMQSCDPPPLSNQPLIEELTQALHDVRLSFSPPGMVIDIEDSRAVVHLIAVAAMGDALLGARLRNKGSEAEEDASRARFEAWLGSLVDLHLRNYHLQMVPR